MSKLEELAKALASKVACDWCKEPLPPDCCCKDAALAALQALLEPSEGMVDAMSMRWAVSSMRPPGDCARSTLKCLFRDAVQAAMEGK